MAEKFVEITSEIYQGQFGEFTITKDDRFGVIMYRSALAIAALCFSVGSLLALLQPTNPDILNWLTWLYIGFSVGLGVALWTIHIYLELLHRVLQIFWAIGTIAAVGVALYFSEPLAIAIYDHPIALIGVGFSFAALTGIFFKETFCFNRFETKFLVPLLPLLILGHLANILPVAIEKVLLGSWAVLFVIFAIRKVTQEIPPDIGDKSVFAYLKAQKQQAV
ncbi:permease of the major facilitator superfamily [Pseudanabaena sp. lw0831]|nr:permease of the major facilitator superfamily [Pseudanabaena sp. lw0831]